MAGPKLPTDHQLVRQLKLRDLVVFSAVARAQSMARAATELGIAQPSVSESIAGLEHLYGVRLFDRSTRGVTLTAYGEALLRRSVGMFDELRQSRSDIAHLADPTSGSLRIACLEGHSVSILAEILLRFMHEYPRAEVHVQHLVPGDTNLDGLRERQYDLAMLRHDALSAAAQTGDLVLEPLFDDGLVIAAGQGNPWTRRRRVSLADLAGEPWILSPPAHWHYKRVDEAFRQLGLEMPRPRLVATTVTMRMRMLAGGPFLSMFSHSVMRANAALFGIRAIDVELSAVSSPVMVATLRGRTVGPLVERFTQTAHAYVRDSQFASATG